MNRLLLIAVLLSAWPTGLGAQACVVLDDSPTYRALVASREAADAERTLALCDTLAHRYEAAAATDCPGYHWLGYYRGMSYTGQNEMEAAVAILHTTILTAEASGLYDLNAHAHLGLALAHEVIERQEDCLRNLQTARQLIQQHELRRVYPRFCVRYASYHRIFGDLDSARIYALEAVRLSDPVTDYLSASSAYLLAGLLAEPPDAAIYYLRSAARLFAEHESYIGAAFQHINIARRQMELDHMEEVAASLDSAGYFATFLPDTAHERYLVRQYLYDQWRAYHEAGGRTDSAYHYLLLSREEERAATGLINQQTINRQEERFEVERERTRSEATRQRLRRTLIGLGVALVLLGAVAALALANYRKQRHVRHQNERISEQNEALARLTRHQQTLLTEIHHRVKNNLQVVISLLTLPSQRQGRALAPKEVEQLSSKIHSISLIHEQLYRTHEFERVDVADYLRTLLLHFQTLSASKTPFDFTLYAEGVTLNLETVMPLGIIVAELTTNALKYAAGRGAPLSLSIKLRQEGDEFFFEFTDNGPGFPAGAGLDGGTNDATMGGLVVRSMARQLRGEFAAFNRAGAVVTLQFREKRVSVVGGN